MIELHEHAIVKIRRAEKLLRDATEILKTVPGYEHAHDDVHWLSIRAHVILHEIEEPEKFR